MVSGETGAVQPDKSTSVHFVGTIAVKVSHPVSISSTSMLYAHPVHRRVRGRASGLVPTLLEIWALILLFTIYLVADTLFGESSYPTVNLVGPLAMSAILGYGGWLMIRSDGKYIWTSLFWFRLSTAVYFGLGTYFIFIMNTYTRLYIEAFYRFSGYDVFKLNLIVTLSAALVLATARIVIQTAGRAGHKDTRRHPALAATNNQKERNLFIASVIFLAIGLTVNYALLVPYQLGWVTYQWPGSLLNLSQLTLVGIFFLTLWSLQYARQLLPVLTGLVIIEMLINLLLFAKSGILMILIMYLLAFLWHKVTIKRLVIIGAIVAGTYATLQPMVGFARQEIGLRYGANTQAGFGERFEILSSYFSTGQTASSGDELQGAISRISYVNAATFVIQQYDTGLPGDWPKLLPAVFVPRFLWPEKPIITDIFVDIYELGTGRNTSAMGAGVFADTYWAMGWWGVFVFMPIYGVILGVLTVFTAKVLRDGRWLYFPLVLMALKMGFRTDGAYISDVAGYTVIIAGSYAVIYTLDVVLKSIKLTRT